MESEDIAKQYCPDSNVIGFGNVKVVATLASAVTVISLTSLVTMELVNTFELGLLFSIFLIDNSTGSTLSFSLKKTSILVNCIVLST